MDVPRPEHPGPQWFRPRWVSLNGEWEFEMDRGDSGLERGLLDRPLSDRITVPFCPESELSGIACADFLNAVWYRREITVPGDWPEGRVLLHFQAVDYDATVWADGTEVGRHRGGYTPFTCDLTDVAARGGSVTIVVRARDDHRHDKPQGKQSHLFHNHGCRYTRTTGIWQTVWLEHVPAAHLEKPAITPDPAKSRFIVQVPVKGPAEAHSVRVTLSDDAGEVAAGEAPADAAMAATLALSISDERRRLWDPDDPHLYDLAFELIDADGQVVDHVESYAGLRSVATRGKAVLINGQPIFQRLVLDQGYYPDGVYTAPSDEALVRDIELSMRAGFNGARLHEKVFEERFLYHADRLGYLVWAEFADWCGAKGLGRPGPAWIGQWMETVRRDRNHPCIVGWCPLNETKDLLGDRVTEHDEVVVGLFHATKAADPTRPVLDTSGYCHRVSAADVWDCHDYCQDPAAFAAHHARLAEGEPYETGPDRPPKWSVPYRGQPFFVSEFGGIWWNPDTAEEEAGWGYGERPASEEEFYERFEALTGTLLDNEHMFGYCYTQLTDVHQEQNGIYRFDRSDKLDVDRIRAAQQRRAAIEPMR